METSVYKHRHDEGLSEDCIVKMECGLLFTYIDKMWLFSCFIVLYFSLDGGVLILFLV